MKRPPAFGSGGFTIVELLVVMGIMALLISAVLSALSKARETAHRATCANNLQQIGASMLLYSEADNNRAFPRTIYDNLGTTVDCGLAGGGSSAVADPFGVGSPLSNNIPSVLFLLLRTQDLTSAVFICPSVAGAVPDDYTAGGTTLPGNKLGQSNWTKFANLSYSIQNPYPTPAALSATPAFNWSPNPPVGSSEYAIAADMNPGIVSGYDETAITSTTCSASIMKKGNSLNHAQTGQNVLYGDCHVAWQATPMCGVQMDNIYGPSAAPSTNSGTTTYTQIVIGNVGPSPSCGYDSVLLPCQNYSTQAAATPTSTPGTPNLPGLWTLKFNEQFTGSALNSVWNASTLWGVANGTLGGSSQSDMGGDTLSPTAVKVNNGLTITATATPLAGRPYTDGQVNTGGEPLGQGGYSFTYGYVVASIQVPQGQGIWPAFWMLPYPTGGKLHDGDGEIDIMEYLGQQPTIDQVHLHHSGTVGTGADTGVNLSGGYHTYAVDWEPDHITWYVDGKAIDTVTANIPSVPEYLILNLAVGSATSWPGSPNSSTVFPATMKVQWVQVWQH